MEIPRPPKPYIVMEVIHKDKTKNKIYSLVSFSEKKKLNLGRKHDSDVRISEDISVSRHHSTVRFEDKTKEYFIEDAASKFGTLILIKKRLVVRDTSSGLAIQVGPNVFRFVVRRALGPPGQKLPEEEEEEEEEEGEEEEEDDEEEGEEEEGEGPNAEVEENLANDQSPLRQAPDNNAGTMIMRVEPRQEERKEESKEG